MKTNVKLLLLLLATLLFGACATIADDPDYLNAFACSVIPSYAEDCLDPEVQDKVKSVLTDGVVAAEIKCRGIAVGAASAVQIYYQASRLQDGACLARSDVARPGTSGFVQATGSELTRRLDPNAESCPVQLFYPAMIGGRVNVVDGVVRFEGTGCTTTPGTACTMPVVGNCTGLNVDQF